MKMVIIKTDSSKRESSKRESSKRESTKRESTKKPKTGIKGTTEATFDKTFEEEELNIIKEVSEQEKPKIVLESDIPKRPEGEPPLVMKETEENSTLELNETMTFETKPIDTKQDLKFDEGARSPTLKLEVKTETKSPEVLTDDITTPKKENKKDFVEKKETEKPPIVLESDVVSDSTKVAEIEENDEIKKKKKFWKKLENDEKQVISTIKQIKDQDVDESDESEEEVKEVVTPNK